MKHSKSLTKRERHGTHCLSNLTLGEDVEHSGNECQRVRHGNERDIPRKPSPYMYMSLWSIHHILPKMLEGAREHVGQPHHMLPTNPRRKGTAKTDA